MEQDRQKQHTLQPSYVKIYLQRISRKQNMKGIKTLIDVQTTTVTTDKDCIRHNVSVDSATVAPVGRMTPTEDNRMQGDETLAEQEKISQKTRQGKRRMTLMSRQNVPWIA